MITLGYIQVQKHIISSTSFKTIWLSVEAVCETESQPSLFCFGELEMIQGLSPTKAFCIGIITIVPHCGFSILGRIIFWYQLLYWSIQFWGWQYTCAEEACNRYSRPHMVRQNSVLNAFESIIWYKLKKMKEKKRKKIHKLKTTDNERKLLHILKS